MNKFDYAQSNSLLKQGIGDQDRSLPNMNGLVGATTAAATDNETEKLKPVKKSQLTKYKTTINKSTNKGQTENQSFNPNNLDESTTTESKKISRKSRVRKPRRIIPNEKEYIPENEQPTQSDVVGGRGGRSNHHPGNRPYWIRILESRTEYTKSRSDNEKSRIAHGILSYIQEELRGRFLNIDSKTKRWYILPNTVVLDKIKQALRDKYIPYWARDLKIEDKKHNTEIGGGISALNQNIVNNRSQLGLNSMLPLDSSYTGMNSSHMFSPAVAMAVMNASRTNLSATSNLGSVKGSDMTSSSQRTSDNINKRANKLDFLLDSSTRQKPRQTAVIPTIDDILKCKIDQMPTFGGTTDPGFVTSAIASAPPPQLPSLGLNPFQSNAPSDLMNSLGIGGLGNSGGLVTEALNRNHGFGTGGNMGAPALSTAVFPSSLGILQSLSMKSLDQYLENRLAEKIAGLPPSLVTPPSMATPPFPVSTIPSLSRLNALAGTSFDSASSSHSPTTGFTPAFTAPEAVAPTGPKKTDWNAMYTSALTNSK